MLNEKTSRSWRKLDRATNFEVMNFFHFSAKNPHRVLFIYIDAYNDINNSVAFFKLSTKAMSAVDCSDG